MIIDLCGLFDMMSVIVRWCQVAEASPYVLSLLSWELWACVYTGTHR